MESSFGREEKGGEEVGTRVRKILHLDMDAFYASVEQRDNPELRGKPVGVGGGAEDRGVIAAASYEARRFGVHSAMPTSRALRLCPELVLVRPRFSRYREISSEIFALYRAVTPLVEPLALDEAFLDVTENAWGETLGVAVARRLKAQIAETTGLSASAGVAPNKFLAKIASGWKKPDGLTVIAPERIEGFLQKLPVEALWGVGPATAARLHGLGVVRAVDLRTVELDRLTSAVGSFARRLVELAHGIDERRVEPNQPRKSVSSETTFAKDLTTRDEIARQIKDLAKDVASFLSKKGMAGRTVTLKLRYSDFTTITRRETLDAGLSDAAEISTRALALLERTEAGTRPVRLVGVGISGFDPPRRSGARPRDMPLLFDRGGS